MKKSAALTNIIASILLQIVTIAYGFLIPKLIIANFGSEVNGLISSITQLLSYISLVEGGITAVVIARLYEPLTQRKTDEINAIVLTGEKFFRRIGVVFIIYATILACIAPLIYSNSGFSYVYIFSLTLILSIGLIIQYMLSLSIKCLLQADKKVSYVAYTQIIILILNTLLAFICIKLYPNIHILKVITGITYLIQPILYRVYAKKHYTLSKNANNDSKILKNRWNGFANNFAYFIHSGTDVTILTFMTNLVLVSVYSVYTLITSGIKSLIGAINTGVFASIGHLYAAGDKEKLAKKIDQYEYIYLNIVLFCCTMACLLITSFVNIYVGDANSNNVYNQPLFGLLIVIATMLDLVKTPHVNIAYAANKFKEITIPCFIEASINIIASIVLVYYFGLIGVAIGTILAMLYRLVYQVAFTKKIIGRSQTKFYRVFIPLIITSTVAIVLCNYICPLNANNISILSWLIYAITYGIIVLLLYMVVNVIFFRKQLFSMIKYNKKDNKRKK